MLFLKPVDSLGFPFLKKMVELELKRTLRTFARSLDVDNWFKRTAGMLGMRRWSWSGRGGWFVFVHGGLAHGVLGGLMPFEASWGKGAKVFSRGPGKKKFQKTFIGNLWHGRTYTCRTLFK